MVSEKRPSFSRREFDLLYKLSAARPWLAKREDAISELLLESCDNHNEQLLVCDLLTRLLYLQMDAVSKALGRIAGQIHDVWKLPANETQLVAATFDTAPDSSQTILQFLRPVFAKKRVSGFRWVNRIGRIATDTHLDTHPNIVLVDEFVGTGATMASRVLAAITHCKESVAARRATRDFRVFVAVIASMKVAKSAVEQDGVKFFSAFWLDKGISDAYSGADLGPTTQRMLRLESTLAPEVNGNKLPSFGYGSAEALYSMEGGNTPNSVFPIFWWWRFANGNDRKTILQRLELGTT